ncbi:MAG: 3-isopropylmalate dehydratase small subunit [bacterium]
MQLIGRAWKFGSNVDTDVIVPARYLTTFDPGELARHCMEGIDPTFSGKCARGDLVVAEWNFGCGSSREHAPIALAGLGVSCVIAKSFARIFYRNAFNLGLPVVEAPEDMIDGIQTGDQLEVDLSNGILTDRASGRSASLPPIPPFMQDLLAAGGLIPYLRNRLSGSRNSLPS